eukprot:12431469-Karenia_brevis.AAC.1
MQLILGARWWMQGDAAIGDAFADLIEKVENYVETESDFDLFEQYLTTARDTCIANDVPPDAGVTSETSMPNTLGNGNASPNKLISAGPMSAHCFASDLAARIAPHELSNLTCLHDGRQHRQVAMYVWRASIGNMTFQEKVSVKPQNVLRYGVPLPQRWRELRTRIQKGQQKAKDYTENANLDVEVVWNHSRTAMIRTAKNKPTHWAAAEAKIQCEYVGDVRAVQEGGQECSNILNTGGWKPFYYGGRGMYRGGGRDHLKSIFRWRAHDNGRVIEEFTTEPHMAVIWYWRLGRGPRAIQAVVQKFEDMFAKAYSAAERATRDFGAGDILCEYLGQPILTENSQRPAEYVQDPRLWQVPLGCQLSRTAVVYRWSAKFRDADHHVSDTITQYVTAAYRNVVGTSRGVPVPEGWCAGLTASKNIEALCQRSVLHAKRRFKGRLVSCDLLGCAQSVDVPLADELVPGQALHVPNLGPILLAAQIQSTKWLCYGLRKESSWFPSQSSLQKVDMDEHGGYQVLPPSRKRLWSKTDPLHQDLIIKRRALSDVVACATWCAEQERERYDPHQVQNVRAAASMFHASPGRWPLGRRWEKVTRLWFIWTHQDPSGRSKEQIISMLAEDALRANRTVPLPRELS